MSQEEIKSRIYTIIFESDTFYGKLFDIILLIAILLSVAEVMLETVSPFAQQYKVALNTAEWVFTILFTIEYALRAYSVNNTKKYIFSFFGVIDFLATIPRYLALFFAGAQYLIVFRVIRLLRVFRILKLVRYIGEAQVLAKALKASRYKITVFLGGVLCVVVVTGTLMYMIEGAENGFTSIPKSIYWCIVTMTTVGYGDIAPQTIPGQTLASLIMIVGYGIIAVPTGIVSVEIAQAQKSSVNFCEVCDAKDHQNDAEFCRKCGQKLKQKQF